MSRNRHQLHTSSSDNALKKMKQGLTGQAKPQTKNRLRGRKGLPAAIKTSKLSPKTAAKSELLGQVNNPFTPPNENGPKLLPAHATAGTSPATTKSRIWQRLLDRKRFRSAIEHGTLEPSLRARRISPPLLMSHPRLRKVLQILLFPVLNKWARIVTVILLVAAIAGTLYI